MDSGYVGTQPGHAFSVLFNSYTFLGAFLPVVIAIYLALRRGKNPVWPIGWLVLASLFYYAWWQPRFLWLLLSSIAVNLLFGDRLIRGNLSRSSSRLVLTAGVAFNLGLLGYFKYAGFFVSNMNDVFGTRWGLPQVVLPIGISFITFQKIAFLVDAHRGLVRNFSLLNYALFVTFFPQLIAGPIVHHAEIMPQLTPATKRGFAADFAVGSAVFIVGLFKKVLVADTFAVYADAGYAVARGGHPLDAASAWVAALSYSFQLYYDFSGYSDMAVGLGRIFGIRLPINFDSPYRASSMIEFWRRWHISFSRFLRDYLYVPLGGSRHGSIRRYANLMIVMLLGGLWHGANWTFVIWGGAHGAMLMLNHGWRALPFSRHATFTTAPARTVGVGITFLAVTLAWVPFRADSLEHAQTMLAHLFAPMFDSDARASLVRFLHAQFAELGDVSAWFKPREMWPVFLERDYLATTAKPVGLLLAGVALVTFCAPNTYQIFANFDPALGASRDPGTVGRGRLPSLDRRAAFVLAGLFVFSVFGLSRVTPFLYFQF